MRHNTTVGIAQRTLRTGTAVLAAAVLAAGCGSADPSGTGDTFPPVDDAAGVDDAVVGTWVLIEAQSDGVAIGVPTELAVTMIFETESVGGNNGCNSYGADVLIGADGSIQVGDISQTLIGCGGAAAEIEQRFMAALAAATRIELDDAGYTLTLVSFDSTWTFERGSTGHGPNGDAAPFSPEGAWSVTEIVVDGAVVEPSADWPVTMTVELDAIGGTAACNGYGGRVVLTPDPDGAPYGGFHVDELAWTEMGCAPEVMDVEQAFLRALQLVDAYAATAAGMQLNTETSMTYVELVAVEPMPDAALSGRRWVLDTHLQGEAASAMAAMEHAYVEFAADGTLSGSTGCRRLVGAWQLDGATLAVPSLEAVDDPAAGVCSPESQQIDGWMISIIETGTQIVIAGDRLTLSAPGGEGLSFRADDLN